jgi:hypothetical protein
MKIEKFKDRLIAFDFESEMVNATDMLRAFPNKRMSDFLKLTQTEEFIEAIKSDNDYSRLTDNEILTIIRGNFSNGKSQGTWMCRILALKFAGWLDPKIELFIYKTFDFVAKEITKNRELKLIEQQRQLDYFWDKSDQKDLYK